MLVLGNNYIAYMLGAVVAGVLSGLLFTEGGLSDAKSSLGTLQLHAWKATLLVVLLFVIWREADDLFDTLVKTSFPIGVYKITQTFVSLLIVWRSSKSVEMQRDEEPRHG